MRGTLDREDIKHRLYFEAEGGIGSWDAEIFLVRMPHMRRDSTSPLLATIKGARLSFRSSLYGAAGYDSVRLDFATEATDDEHDRAHLADLWFLAPLWPLGPALDDDFTILAGIAVDLRLPTQEWLDGQLASTKYCTYCEGKKRHQIVKYLPPERPEVEALTGRGIVAELTRRKEQDAS